MKQASSLIILTENLIRSGMKGGIGMKHSQADALGIPWPLKAGWMAELIGKSVTEDQFSDFLGGRDKKAIKWKPRRRRRAR